MSEALKLISSRRLHSDESWIIMLLGDRPALGIKTHMMGGSTYQTFCQLTEEEAKLLIIEGKARDAFGLFQ